MILKSFVSRGGTTRTRRRSARAATVVLALVVVGLLTSACGGAASPGVASLGSTTTTTTLAPAAAGNSGTPSGVGNKLDEYSSCMRSHGVPNFPDPTIQANGVSLRIGPGTGVNPKSPQFQSAQKTCQHLLPNGGPGGGTPLTPKQQASYLKAVACMRSHGFPNFPDPTFSGSRVSFSLPAGMDANSTQFLRARETCETLIPAGLPYSKQAEGGK